MSMVTPLMRTHVARRRRARRRRADAPAHLAVRAADAELGLLRACRPATCRCAICSQRAQIVGMNERADVVGRDLEACRLDAENAVLALVPDAIRRSPMSQSHEPIWPAASARLRPCSLCEQPSVGGFELGGALARRAARARR